MLKISQVPTTNHAVMLRLEGRVVGPWVSELQMVCDQVLKDGNALRLHLANVEFMDAHGVVLLMALRSRGVNFIECPPFAAEQLKMTSS